jgi:hypothetical protein
MFVSSKPSLFPLSAVFVFLRVFLSICLSSFPWFSLCFVFLVDLVWFVMWKLVKEVVSDARFIVRNRKRYGDLEVARAKRIQAENMLKGLAKRAIREEKEMLDAKEMALKQLGGMKRYKKALDEHNQQIFESLQQMKTEEESDLPLDGQDDNVGEEKKEK